MLRESLLGAGESAVAHDREVRRLDDLLHREVTGPLVVLDAAQRAATAGELRLAPVAGEVPVGTLQDLRAWDCVAHDAAADLLQLLIWNFG